MIVSDQKDNQTQTAPSGDGVVSDGAIVKDAAPCFTAGTKIIGCGGEVLVENIKIGDLILTADHGFQPVRWVGRRHVSSEDLRRYPQLRPYVIAQGAFGNQRDLRVSPQHGMARRMQGEETLLRAKNVGAVLGEEIAHRDTDCDDVVYFHIMFDQHELVFAEGALTEAYFPVLRRLAPLIKTRGMNCCFCFQSCATFGPAQDLQTKCSAALRAVITSHFQSKSRLSATALY